VLAFPGRVRPGEPPPRVAVLDLGTNTALCTVLFGDPAQPRRLRIAEELHFVTGLGRDRRADAALHPRGMARALRALSHISGRLVSMGVATSSVRGVATAACREAPNGEEFLAAVWQEHGLPFEVVTGEREAELMALAQARSFSAAPSVLAVDIGGGSTEIALSGSASDWRCSVPVGATTLSEALGSRGTLDAGLARVAGHVAALQLGPIPDDAALIGVSGTVTTALATLDAQGLWDPEQLHGRTLDRQDAASLAERLFAMTPTERRALPGLHPGRADALGPSLLWLVALMDALGRRDLVVSDRGVRFGLLFDAWPRAVVSERYSAPTAKCT